ncbi:hypothetical protein LIER_14974 [Lithospermum erythrorhizon]|uniref:Retrotransposon gag domain-containing protein n=1 Tax=Lithospermum erythrorhizon TaxID=34254 RepID=A0AAV3Q160_LITER
MMIALEARDKLGFLTGEVEIPTENSTSYKQWRKVNSTFISWIMNAMTSEIFVFAKDAKVSWNEIKESFEGSNGLRVYDLRRKIYAARQGMDTVSKYYNTLKSYWDELRILKPSVVQNTDGEERMM